MKIYKLIFMIINNKITKKIKKLTNIQNTQKITNYIYN